MINRWMPALVLGLSAGVCAAADVPQTYRGHWVPQGQACNGPLSLEISAQAITLRSATHAARRPVDACHACGGPDLGEVWLAPTDVTEFDFIVYAQGEGQARSIRMDPISAPLQALFPPSARRFKACVKA